VIDTISLSVKLLQQIGHSVSVLSVLLYANLFISRTTFSLRSSCCELLLSVSDNSSSISYALFSVVFTNSVSIAGVDNITVGPILFAILTIVNNEPRESWGSFDNGGGRGIWGDWDWE
jgi:hypothetical protein